MGKDKIIKIVNLDDDVKSEFAAWLDRVPKEAGQDKTWSERYEDLFRKSNGNNNYLYDYLKKQDYNFKYTGVDILPDMIFRAKEKNPQAEFFSANIFAFCPYSPVSLCFFSLCCRVCLFICSASAAFEMFPLASSKASLIILASMSSRYLSSGISLS